MHERTAAARAVEMGHAASGKPKELLKHRGKGAKPSGAPCVASLGLDLRLLG